VRCSRHWRACARRRSSARAYDEEHRVAETLQRSLLPKRIPPVAGMAIGVRYVPAGPGLDVGGDWYDVLETADGHLLAVVGDVVGHGLEAAASMGQIRNALRAYALEGLGPGDAVARTSALVQAVGQGEMTTAAVVRFDPATRSLRYTCAGHPPPLVISPDGEVVRLEGGRTLPLGVAPLVPDEASATVPDGATLLLYTDGLVERRGSSLDAGIARLSETAAAAAAEDVDALLDQVLALAGESRSDDVALLALRPLPVANEPLALRLPADPASLVHLRRSLRAYLERAGLGPEETYDVVLACSEAAANAIEHGTAPPAAEFAVRAEIVGGELRVAVTDSGRWRPPRERGRGRGLPLMRALMETVDVETGAGGTEVRMRRCLLAGAPARRGSAFRA
jgi:anti-sigma regulatory factor (Ser/Thr protein kinase)